MAGEGLMATISRGKMGARERTADMREGASRARDARWTVASQLAQHVVRADLTGSREYVALRTRHLAEAFASGDPVVARAAAMDLAGAAAAYAVQVDLQTPTTGERGPVPEMTLMEQCGRCGGSGRRKGRDCDACTAGWIPLSPAAGLDASRNGG